MEENKKVKKTDEEIFQILQELKQDDNYYKELLNTIESEKESDYCVYDYYNWDYPLTISLTNR